jgi:CDP-diacylglycerol--glycerol-3-phosphate 3-phosphatidyltransferase
VRARTGFRRLVGLDRSGPRPRQTRRGEPLRPFTLPNLVGYARLAAIPAFLYLGLGSDDGRWAPATILFVFITAGDYLDGFLARATGQYSRLGALLDPLIDRLAVVAGAIVAWKFELVPRWAIGVAAAREVAMLVLSEAAIRRGIEIEINWVGRIAVTLTFSGLGLAMIFASWVPKAIFIAGVVLSLCATVLYVRAGRAASREAATPRAPRADAGIPPER